MSACCPDSSCAGLVAATASHGWVEADSRYAQPMNTRQADAGIGSERSFQAVGDLWGAI